MQWGLMILQRHATQQNVMDRQKGQIVENYFHVALTIGSEFSQFLFFPRKSRVLSLQSNISKFNLENIWDELSPTCLEWGKLCSSAGL